MSFIFPFINAELQNTESKIEKTENNNELKLEFTIEAKKFDEAIIKVFNKSAKYFNIPGFRKGKAPF